MCKEELINELREIEIEARMVGAANQAAAQSALQASTTYATSVAPTIPETYVTKVAKLVGRLAHAEVLSLELHSKLCEVVK